MAWQSGQSLYGDRYTIRKKLGQGGFGITYLAEDGQGQQVVIKTLTDEIMNSLDDTGDHDKFLRDFEKEALSLALCRHPHIVQIDNFFTHQGFPCIVMEYVEGLDLGKRLRQQGALPEAEAVRYMQQVGDGLRVIHQKGRLHRDIKPQNIMVRANTQEAVLIDFGIAREFLPDVTQTHTAILTPGFAPIEQYDDQARRGEFTDVYALAATLSALITGKNPQPSFMRAVRDCFKVPNNCSAAVRMAIKEGMALQSEDRPKTVTAWLNLLQPPKPRFKVPAQYQRLAKLLEAGDWQGADVETARQILAVANCTEAGCLDVEALTDFPCEDLWAIDQLWVYYSQGRFGFSVQQQIYEALGWTDKYNDKGWWALSKAVGWVKWNNKYKTYQQLDFDINAKEGHLPVLVYGVIFLPPASWFLGVGVYFFARIQACLELQPEAHLQTVTNSLQLLQPPKPQFKTPTRYQQLAELLKAQDWRGADEETARQILAVANCTKESCLDAKTINKFPCEDLLAIDQLWVHYSQGRFGFSVQQQIYQVLGGTEEYDSQIWKSFCNSVGWRQKNEYLNYQNLAFSTNAKEGHLPAAVFGFTVSGLVGVPWIVWNYVGVWGGQDRVSLMSRFLACSL